MLSQLSKHCPFLTINVFFVLQYVILDQRRESMKTKLVTARMEEAGQFHEKDLMVEFL
jgi:hypothetical protein